MCFTSLSYSNSKKSTVKRKNPNNSPTINLADVYVAGQKNSEAVYWKNTQLHVLDNDGFSFSSADTIIVKNNTIHISGTVLNYPIYEKAYWKNALASGA